MKTEDILRELTRFDTPTICNAIEFVLGGRQGEGFTERPIVAAHPSLPPVVGYVATARVRARAPSSKPAAEAKAIRIGYYEYIAKAPRPCIVAIQDLDEPAGHGAFWGEVQVSVHKGLGIAGGITSGSIRDLDVIDPWFPLMAGSVSPSHAHVHVVDFNVDVEVLGMKLKPNDLVHMDRHGAVRVPKDKLGDLLRCVELVIRKEAPILKAAKSPGFGIEALRKALQESEDIH
jgi:regulator of RNase E activity RraA